MPFQSEKQRRYLWANEPEIARDWTDTYGSKIHAADGGIMRLPFDNGGEVVDDNEKTYEDSPYSNKYTEEEFNEVFGKTDPTSWYDQPTLERMWKDPNRPEDFGLGTMRNWATDKLGTGFNWARDKLGTGVDWGKMAMRGIGNFIAPGLGFALGALPQDTAAQRFNRSFTVGGGNMPTDPYGYYGALRGGNLNQDPFGRNPVSAFGNYGSTLANDANYMGTNKFGLAKKDFAQGYFNEKAATTAPQEDANIGVSHFGNGNKGNGNKGSGKGGHGSSTGMHRARGGRMNRGGIADLWQR